MRSLHALELVHVAEVDAMLLHLRFAPALRSLLIVPDCSLPPSPPPPPPAVPQVSAILASLAPGSPLLPPPPAPVVDLNDPPVPSVAALLDLLRDAPQLRCQLTLQWPVALPRLHPKESDQLQQLHLDALSAPFAVACALFTDPCVVGRFAFSAERSSDAEDCAM